MMTKSAMKTVGTDQTDSSRGCQVAGISDELSFDEVERAAEKDTPDAVAGFPWKLVIGGVLVLGLIVASFIWKQQVADGFNATLAWVESLGPMKYVVFIGLYIAATVLFLPGSIFTLGAGILFGVIGGTVVVSIGSTLGAAAAFWVGRTVARDAIAKKVAGNAKFAAIDEAVGREGFKIVLLTRLSPIFPFNLLNYAYGLTRVKFWEYVLASWIGMLPGTVMYVYLGVALGSLAKLAAGEPPPANPWQPVFFWGGLVVAVVVAVFITFVARKALKKAVPAEGAPHD